MRRPRSLVQWMAETDPDDFLLPWMMFWSTLAGLWLLIIVLAAD